MSILATVSVQKSKQLHKFGGNSLADVSCYQRVASIMANYSKPGDLMVVSAAGNTTNQLIMWLKLNKIDFKSAYSIKKRLYCYQSNLIKGLLPPGLANLLLARFIEDLKYLSKLLNGEITDAVYAEVVGYGEVWSARLMAAVLQEHDIEACWLDTREFLRAEREVQPKIDKAKSYSLLQRMITQYTQKRLVMTGFICRNEAGETVLLGRNGSDYSATQIGALAGVNCVTIWRDIAGVYSADPRKVKDACLLSFLRMDEANELARLAAPVLHARTLQPISNSDINLHFRCSYQPEQGSTRIERVLSSSKGASCIITSHDNVCLIEIVVPLKYNYLKLYKLIENLLKCAQIYPLAIGIQSNRQMIQLCYTSEVVNNAFDFLQKAGLPFHLQLREGLALVALVGAGISRKPLYSYCFWQQIKDLPIEFIWQSEEDISIVAVLRIKGSTLHLVQRLHQSIFRTEKRIRIILFEKVISVLIG